MRDCDGTPATMSGSSPPEGRNDPLRGHPDSRLPSVADVEACPPQTAPIDARADVGHVNLTVVDIDRPLAFYRDVLGLNVTTRDEQSAFLAAGTYHHHVALNTWDEEATAPPAHSTGLHHFALRLPDAAALAEVMIRVLRGGQ
jgi:catechol 2,3-dioxygenase